MIYLSALVAGSFMVLSVINPARSAFSFQDGPQCPRWTRAFLAMPTRPVEIRTAAGSRMLVLARLAATDEARWAGFQCASPGEIRKTMILFDFGQEVQGEFHMRNVPAPLDIAFVTASGRIVAILRMDPSPTAIYRPPAPYRYAIEARAGFFSERGIVPGDTVQPQAPR